MSSRFVELVKGLTYIRLKRFNFFVLFPLVCGYEHVAHNLLLFYIQKKIAEKLSKTLNIIIINLLYTGTIQ